MGGPGQGPMTFQQTRCQAQPRGILLIRRQTSSGQQPHNWAKPQGPLIGRWWISR